MLSALHILTLFLCCFRAFKIFLSTKLVGIQDRQCTYNLTLRQPATKVTVENQKALRILGVCWSLRYLACKAHAPFRHLWPVWIYQSFRCIRKIAKSDDSALTYLSFRLSIRLEQLGSHWTDFH